jgi:hypothetical protein
MNLIERPAYSKRILPFINKPVYRNGMLHKNLIDFLMMEC